MARRRCVLTFEYDSVSALEVDRVQLNSPTFAKSNVVYILQSGDIKMMGAEVNDVIDPATQIAEEIVNTLFTQKGENVDKIKPIIERILKDGK